MVGMTTPPFSEDGEAVSVVALDQCSCQAESSVPKAGHSEAEARMPGLCIGAKVFLGFGVRHTVDPWCPRVCGSQEATVEEKPMLGTHSAQCCTVDAGFTFPTPPPNFQ